MGENPTPPGEAAPPPAGPVRERPFPEIEVPSWDQVALEADKIGLAQWRAKDWFNEMQQTGWRDSKNRDVFNWRAYLQRVKGWWERDGRPLQPPVRANGSARPTTPMDLKTIIEAKKTKASELKNRFCSDTAIDSVWSDPLKHKEFVSLRKEIRELTNQLSNMA